MRRSLKQKELQGLFLLLVSEDSIASHWRCHGADVFMVVSQTSLNIAIVPHPLPQMRMRDTEMTHEPLFLPVGETQPQWPTPNGTQAIG